MFAQPELHHVYDQMVRNRKKKIITDWMCGGELNQRIKVEMWKSHPSISICRRKKKKNDHHMAGEYEIGLK